MDITAANVEKALDWFKGGGRSETHKRPARNTYIWCPVDQTLWDLKPIVSIIPGVNQKTWVTTTYEKKLPKVGFPVIKFRNEKNRELGISGFDDTELHGDHTLFRAPDGVNIEEIENGLWPGESVSNAQGSATRQVLTNRFVRNSRLIQKILKDANGYCSACGDRAFCKPSGVWFLEVHHKNWLRDGGADAEANMIALCPNCHRQEHHGADRRYF